MKLPGDLAYPKLFKRGALLYQELKTELETGPRNKYMVVVSIDDKDKPVLVALTTSQVEKFRSRVRVPGFIGIAKDETDLFAKDTIVDCRKLHERTREKMIRDYESEDLEYKGTIPDHLMGRIDQALYSAETLTSAQKKATVPSDFGTNHGENPKPEKK